MSPTTKHHLLPPEFESARLDQTASQAFELGLRQTRRLIAAGRLRVDGRVCPKSTLVRAGQDLALLDAYEESLLPGVAVLAQSEQFAALCKPSGMHSAAGQGMGSVDRALPGLGLPGWQLLNRLDFLTSGVVLAAAREEAQAQYIQWQASGLVSKWYLAVVQGRPGSLEIHKTIQDARCRVVRVLESEDDAVRRTQVWTLDSTGETSLVLVRIFKGRRHQIRAHLAWAGHPILGDPVYGAGEPGGLFLHHFQVNMPGLTATSLPTWPGISIPQAAIETLISD